MKTHNQQNRSINHMPDDLTTKTKLDFRRIKLGVLALLITAAFSSCVVSAHPYGAHWVPGHYEPGYYHSHWVPGHWA